MMASLTFAILVIVATFGTETAFATKQAIIQYDDSNVGNSVVTIFNKDGNVGNVKVVDIYNKDKNKHTRIMTIKDKNLEISISEDKCIVSSLDDEQEGQCTDLVRMQSDVPAEVAEECKNRDVYIEKPKPCTAAVPFGCWDVCYEKCWDCLIWLKCCGELCLKVCNK